MAESDQTDSSPSVQIANQFIDMANTHIQNGSGVQDIASGLRHAAANFSAYAFFRDDQVPKDPNTAVEEFIRFLEHYLDLHKPKEAPGDGLFQVIEQAKKDL